MTITNIDTLVAAHKKALAGKRRDSTAVKTNYHFMSELARLQSDLRLGTYQPTPYRCRVIYEPKRRRIQAPAFSDRIVHHAIYSVLNPFYERHFISDSYACRSGRGIHAATRRIQHFLTKADSPLYVCKIDISKYFPSVNHGRLLEIISSKIHDPELIDLLKVIIDSSTSGHEYDDLFAPDSYFQTKGPRGIPIGNLTSQLFANIYLHQADMYAKQQLKIRRYIRYMDDILFFHEDKSQLHAWQLAMTEFLYENLYLTVNPRKVRLYPAAQGVDFVGYIVFPKYMRLRGSSVRRFKKRYRRQLQHYLQGDMSMKQIQFSFDCWQAHAAHAKTKHLVSTLKSWQDDYQFVRHVQQKHRRTSIVKPPVQLSLFDD